MFCLESIAQHPGLCTSLPEALAEGETRQKNREQQAFYRSATVEEKAKYKALTGTGSAKKKALFLNMCAAQKLTKATATQENTQASTQSDTRVGKYRNF